MDNIKAKNGIRQILLNLENDDLLALAATVTQGLLKKKLNNREGWSSFYLHVYFK